MNYAFGPEYWVFTVATLTSFGQARPGRFSAFLVIVKD
jgi:hypothetical protein